MGGNGQAEIINNIVAENSSGDGGGIELFASGRAQIRNNRILGNIGGGIFVINDSPAAIVQNLIAGNVGYRGAGIYLYWPAVLVNNTIVDNDGAACSGLGVYAFYPAFHAVNNIIVAHDNQTAVCADNMVASPAFNNNNVWSPRGAAYGGFAPNLTGKAENISADPLFANPVNGDYHLRPESPSINAGDILAEFLPELDLDGNPRVSKDHVDQGVYEFMP